MSSKNFNSFKDFQSDQIQTSSRKLFTAHYACSNSDLNLTLVTGTTNGFIFQIINSLVESWGYAWPVLTVIRCLIISRTSLGNCVRRKRTQPILQGAVTNFIGTLCRILHIPLVGHIFVPFSSPFWIYNIMHASSPRYDVMRTHEFIATRT